MAPLDNNRQTLVWRQRLIVERVDHRGDGETPEGSREPPEPSVVRETGTDLSRLSRNEMKPASSLKPQHMPH